MSPLEISRDIIAPIFIVVALAALTDRVFKVEPQGISRLVVYLFTPFLVFDGLANSDLSAGEAGQLALVAFATQMTIALLAWGIISRAKSQRALAGSFVVVAALINARSAQNAR